ncbi:MAG: hypothetical protein M0P71_12870 [Melioribacteraceae bacterium]|nr:hypothetical protein [Melioribacteraceae bacterium]
MAFKNSLIDVDVEKEIITGLITDPRYTIEILPIFKKELLQIPFAKTVSKWCFDYYQKYKKAPGSDIQGMYDTYCNDNKADPAQIELIGKFLSGLSTRYEKANNVKYKVDKAELYFQAREVEILKDSLSVLLVNNKIKDAHKAIAEFKRTERAQTIGIDIVRDNILNILFAEDDNLFDFPGDLGKMFGTICRQDYILIAAPMKRGKSFWLAEFGLRGLMRGLNIIYYSLEMSEKKMLNRIYQYFLGESRIEKTIEHFPFFTKENEIDYKELFKKGLSAGAIQKKRKQIEGMLSGNSFRLCCYPTGSINVKDIKTHLSNLEHYNKFIPDIIIVDYADIMSPESGDKEHRQKLNATQEALRGLAQEKNCVVISATQTDRSTFKKNIEEDTIAEDIRKLAHATHVMALNQSREDKKNSIMRVSMLVARDDEFHVDDEVIVLECRSIGKVCLDSKWAKNVEGL